jgi:Tol biopolymer transport system component
MKLDGAGLFWRLADGSGPFERLSEDLRQDTSDWSADGNHLAVVNYSGDIVILSQSGGRTSATPWLSTPAYEQYPMWSPDGRWLAYSSNDSGKSEVYVQPYPGPGPRVQISRGGGVSPVWSRDGREIFYAQGNSRGTADIDHPIVSIMAAPITLTPTITAGTPHKLFEGPYAITGQARGFDVSPDGKRFLMVLPEEHLPRPATEITIVQNWFEELRRLVAIK